LDVFAVETERFYIAPPVKEVQEPVRTSEEQLDMIVAEVPEESDLDNLNLEVDVPGRCIAATLTNVRVS
jgi:hypothetical protein